MVREEQPSFDQTKYAAKASTPARPAEAWNLPDSSRDLSFVGRIPVQSLAAAPEGWRPRNTPQNTLLCSGGP